jgi:hypothetical protein
MPLSTPHAGKMFPRLGQFAIYLVVRSRQITGLDCLLRQIVSAAQKQFRAF